MAASLLQPPENPEVPTRVEDAFALERLPSRPVTGRRL